MHAIKSILIKFIVNKIESIKITWAKNLSASLGLATTVSFPSFYLKAKDYSLIPAYMAFASSTGLTLSSVASFYTRTARSLAATISC
jgi:hypothetical protein